MNSRKIYSMPPTICSLYYCKHILKDKNEEWNSKKLPNFTKLTKICFNLQFYLF